MLLLNNKLGEGEYMNNVHTATVQKNLSGMTSKKLACLLCTTALPRETVIEIERILSQRKSSGKFTFFSAKTRR